MDESTFCHKDCELLLLNRGPLSVKTSAGVLSIMKMADGRAVIVGEEQIFSKLVADLQPVLATQCEETIGFEGPHHQATAWLANGVLL